MVKSLSPFIIASLVLTVAIQSLTGQITGDEMPSATEGILLKNVQIKSSPDQEIIRGDVFIKDGIILSVGKEVDDAHSAKVIEGDSLLVYAAFISALTHFGQKEEDDDVRRSAWRGPPGSTPYDQSGITPEVKAGDNYKPSSKDIKAFHQEGFGIIHTVPRGFVMAGKGEIHLLADLSKDNGLLMENTGLFAQFRNMARVYPATPLATMSVWREILTDVKSQYSYYQKWMVNPTGAERPILSESHKSLIPIIENEQPVFFNTPETKTILRALKLSRELDFSLVLSNVSYMPPAIQEEVDDQVKILVDLNFPENPDPKSTKSDKKEDKGDKKDRGKKKSKDEEKKEEDEIPEGMQKEEFERLMKERMGAYRENMELAKRCVDQNLLGGFSMLDIKPGDIQKNLRLLVDFGMSSEDILAALTIWPSELLKIDHLVGKVAEGYQAHLTVYNKEFTDKDAKVIYMIVDGELISYKK